jgi:hypothetical protein
MILHTEAFDASEVEERPRSQYMSSKDIRNLAIVFVVILLMLWPLYGFFKRNTEEHICKNNIRAIGQALLLYSQENSDMFPLAFEPDGPESDVPKMTEKGAAVAWATALIPYVTDESIFTCPTADETEYAKVEGNEGKTLPSTYGFYAPYSGASTISTVNPGRTVIIAETSNMGAQDTFDPLKFQDIPQDGFVIGFDNNQFLADKDTKYVTRLAFPGSGSGNFSADGRSRHGGGIHGLTIDGSLLQFGPASAEVKRIGGYWTPPLRSMTSPLFGGGSKGP